MTARQRALWPDGLAGRFVLLLAGALAAASLVAILAMSLERGRFDRAALAEREVARIVALVPALNALKPGQREAVVRRVSTRSATVSLAPAPLVARTPDDARSRALEALIRGALGDQPLAAAVLPGGDPSGWRRGGSPDVIAISIALSRGPGPAPLWLNVRAQAPPVGRRGIEGDVVLLVFALSLAAVLGVGVLFARRLTRPLEQLARAADAVGQGDRSVRVPEDGPRELRAVAQAFNQMQLRISRFDAERMRTLAAVGHDLRTPITSLRIRAEMLDEQDLREPMIRTLDEMTVMADGLVAYAKGSRDAETSERVELGPFLRRLCQDRGATFQAGSEIAIMARPVALGRALGNLIDNAIRYGGSASVRLERDGAAVVISVEDDGPGLSPERLETVFEPFVRGEDSRSTQTGGTGLGLSIARDIVTAHGGTIRLENRQDRGLRATVRLPLGRTKEQPPRESSWRLQRATVAAAPPED